MLRMVCEKEVVLNIRHRIEIHEQERLFRDNAPSDSGGTPASFEYSHIHLGSRQRALKVLSYEQDLETELGFCGFSDSLARFIRDYTPIEVYGSDFDGDGFEGHKHCINWRKVQYSHSPQHRFTNLVTGLPSSFMQGFL